MRPVTAFSFPLRPFPSSRSCKPPQYPGRELAPTWTATWANPAADHLLRSEPASQVAFPVTNPVWGLLLLILPAGLRLPRNSAVRKGSPSRSNHVASVRMTGLSVRQPRSRGSSQSGYPRDLGRGREETMAGDHRSPLESLTPWEKPTTRRLSSVRRRAGCSTSSHWSPEAICW